MTWCETARRWFLLLAISIAGVAAQPGQPLADSSAWERIGATMTYSNGFAFSGDPVSPVIWINRGGQIWRLQDGEGTWEKFRSSGGPILFLGATDPVPDTILASGSRRSTDGGMSWPQTTWADTGEPFFGGPGIAEAPEGSPYAGRIFAGSSFTGNGRFGYSTDRASTWHAPTTLTGMGIADLVALRSGRVITAGFIGAALSDDGGVTFEPIPELYQEGLIRYDHEAIVVLPGFTPKAAEGGSTEGRLMVVSTERGRPGLRVRVSDDEGDSWREASWIPTEGSGLADLSALPEAVGGGSGWAVLGQKDGRIWGTVDGGETWVPFGLVPESGAASDPYNFLNGLAVGPDGRLYAGSAFRWSWRTVGRVGDALRSAFAVTAEGELTPAVNLRVVVFPNPTDSRTTAVLEVGAPQAVRVAVYDALGREVVVAWDGPVSGEQHIEVDTGLMAVGTYVIRATTADGVTKTAHFTVAR